MANSMLSVLGQDPVGEKPKTKPSAKAAPKVKVIKEVPKKKKQETASLKKPPAFPGTKKQPPIYWGSCTIYTSDKKWRVKLNAGDRLDVGRPFTDNPKKGWQAVINLCRERGTFD